jgi:hypothetical protein
VLSLLIFSPTIFGTPLWDDWSFIFRNAQLRYNTSLLSYFNGAEVRAWPFFHATLWLMLKTFKQNYYLYHLTNIFLHGINGFLCYKLLRKINIKNSFLIALIFMAHPLQLFIVGWIIQIKTLLATTFLLLTLIFLHRFYEKKKIVNLILAIIAYGISVFSKSTTSAFSLCLIGIYPFLKNKKQAKSYILIILPFCALSLFAASMTVWDASLRSQLVFIIGVSIASYFLFKNYRYFLNNLAITSAIVFTLSILKFSYMADELPLVFFFLIIFWFSLFKFEIRNKKRLSLFVVFCFISSFYALSLNVILSSISPQVQAERILFTFKNLIRYVEFLFLPFDNNLFSLSTKVSFTSFEFIQIFTVLLILFYFARKLYCEKQYMVLIGFVFFLITILPFCGFFIIPIFSYTNFIPYWLSIPMIGLLPVIDYLIDSKKILILLVSAFICITHIQSYKFYHTENIFLESIKKLPNPLFQVALVEHYVFTGDCQKARTLLSEIQNQELLIEFNTEKKVIQCKVMAR